MSTEFENVPLAEAAKGLKGIGPDAEGRYSFQNRQPPAGYITFRDSWRVADVHPSWLRTLVSGGGLTKYDAEGAPAAIRNGRGTWAVRIDALQSYEAVKRVPGEGTGEGAVYKYEPMVLKSCKRAATAIKEYEAAVPQADIVQAGMDALVEHLKGLWESGAIGKDTAEGDDKPKPKSKTKKAEAPEETAEEEELDFDFDFGDDDS